MRSLFDEADTVAAALRRLPKFVEDDLRIAFRKIQSRRLPNLPAEEFDQLYGTWRDRHDGRRVLERRTRLARVPKLLKQRDQLFSAREAAGTAEERVVLTGVLHDLTSQIASLLKPRDGRAPMPADATWD